MAYRLLGSGTTDSNGRAIHTYTGTGAGLLNVIASLDNPHSDFIFNDKMENNTNYNLYTKLNNATLEYSTEYHKTGNKSLKWTITSSSSGDSLYWGVLFQSTGSDVLPVNLLKGNTVRFEADTKATNTGTSFDVFVKTVSNPSWARAGQENIGTGENHYMIEYSFPSDVTDVWVRFDCASAKNMFLYVDDLVLYSLEGSYQSEPYSILDTLYHDEMTSDTHTNYSKVNADLTFDTDKLVLTRTADGECYANYTGTIANYKGKTIKFECEIDSPVNSHTRIYQQVGGSYSSVTSEYKTSGLFVATSEIDANATSILFRIMGNNLNSNQGLSFKNIKIYPI